MNFKIEKWLKKLFLIYLTTKSVLSQLTEPATNTGYHLSKDKIPILARRLFQIPIQQTGRDISSPNGELSPGTWQMSNGQKSFPEVRRVYSWALNDDQSGNKFSMFKDNMGKMGFWQLAEGQQHLLEPNSIYNQNNGNFVIGRVRARIDALTGECSHKMHYRKPYLIVICYNQNAIHNTLNQPMVYDYYIRVGDNRWNIGGQNYMNSTASTNTPIGTAGKGTINVDFNHRIHVTTVRATRTNALIDGGTYNSWWTLTWNGPYEGQMSSSGRFPNPSGPATSTDPASVQFKSNNVVFLRPFADIRYTKMCIITIPNLKVIIDIVQPRSNSNQLMVTFLNTNNGHNLARCTLDQTNLNLDPQVAPWGQSNTQCIQNCQIMTMTRGIGAGGIKYVPGTGNDDFLVIVDQSAGKLTRCRWRRNLNGPEDQCQETPICPENNNKNNFGYFSDCRSITSCGVYYMYRVGTGPISLLDRVSCVDMVKFTGKPLSYRRHFTAIHAYDVANTVQSGIESEANSMNIRSYMELYVYNSRVGSLLKNEEKSYSYLARYYDREAVTQQDLTITGRVVRVQDPNSIEGVYPMLGYANHTYRLPFKRENWKGNALNVRINGRDVNSSVLLLNDINMDNTDNVVTRDQIPMGTESVRIRDNFGSNKDTVIEMLRCRINYNYTVDMNCTQFGSRRTINKESSTVNREVILRAWWFDNSIVLLTTDRTKANPAQVNRYRWSCYDKKNDKWTGNQMNAGTILEFYDAAEHNGDLIIAYKLYAAKWHPNPITTRRVTNLDCTNGWTNDFPDAPHITSNMNEHPAGINRGRPYTRNRYHPLEDDACHTGMNIVWDTSWKIRYLMDCNRKSVPTNNKWGNSKWIADQYLVDNPSLGQYRTVWNISMRPNELSSTDFLGDDFEIGCATSEYVIVTDNENPQNDGWLVAAVHIRTHAVLFYDLDQFGISRVDTIMCVKDNVILTGVSTNSNTRGFIAVLHGDNLDEARRRIHSIEKFPFLINSLTGTLVEDKLWIRFVANGNVYYRVAFMDGPIVQYNATNSHYASSTSLNTTNGYNDPKITQTPVTFIWGNNEVNITDITRQKFGTGNYDLEKFSNIRGHVYTVTSKGIHANETAVKQRVFKTDELIARRALQGPTPNGGRRYYEMRIKKDRMARLAWVNYFSEFSYYKNPNNKIYSENLNIECQHLDFTTIPATTITQIYYATVCQRVHYKEVRIYRENEANNNLDMKKRLVHNDDVHKLSLDYISSTRYLLCLYNKNHKILNISVFDFSGVTDTGFATSDIQAPLQTYLVQNVSDWSVFHTNGNLGIMYCLSTQGTCKTRYALGGTSGLLDGNIYTLDVSTDLARIYHVDCHTSDTTQTNISCAIVGGDRRMFHYTFTPNGNSTINPLKRFIYQLYKDYEPLDLQMGSRYIILKSESLDFKDKSVLVYKRQDVQDPGIGFLYGGVNGTVAGWDRWDWKNTRVQLAEYGGTHKIFLQHNEAINAEIYEIGPLRISLNTASWQNQKLNCILFDGSENSKCVPVQDVWYRDIPNQPGPPEKKIEFKSDFWLKFLLWVLLGLVILGALAYLFLLFQASPKPGYKKVGGEKRDFVYEEREEYYDDYENGGSTHRGFVGRNDMYHGQEELYGDYGGGVLR